jgi:hypothetical protein
MKYVKLSKCSHDTALREIAALVERGILVRNSLAGAQHQLFGFGWQRLFKPGDRAQEKTLARST